MSDLRSQLKQAMREAAFMHGPAEVLREKKIALAEFVIANAETLLAALDLPTDREQSLKQLLQGVPHIGRLCAALNRCESDAETSRQREIREWLDSRRAALESA